MKSSHRRYQNAKSYIKWNGQISEEFFIIERGVRQGGTLSADLYKVYYINPLSDILSNSGLGGKIGNTLLCKLVILNLCFLFQILQ
jgi:hypothetical protein